MLSRLRALPDRWARRLRAKAERRLFPRGLRRTAIGRTHAGGVLDAVETTGDGIVAVVGWAADEQAFVDGLSLTGHGVRLVPTHVFRVPRPDLTTLGGRHPERLGIVAEFVLPVELSGRALDVTLGEAAVARFDVPVFQPPHYHDLYGNPGVWHRDQVYGVGPPLPTVSREIFDLCSDLPGPILDFGCGAGALLSRLREQGLDASGLELDTPVMRAATVPGAAGHVTFYSGAMPAPFAGGAYATVTCCEVLEHIPEYLAAVAEIARLARTRAMITVPDMSSIPRGLGHGVVPWHLLEGSHVNFFTQASLEATLAPHFSRIRFARIGEIRCDRMRFYTSLVAICDK
jgi:SAM-dependent methyltransferase